MARGIDVRDQHRDRRVGIGRHFGRVSADRGPVADGLAGAECIRRQPIQWRAGRREQQERFIGFAAARAEPAR